MNFVFERIISHVTSLEDISADDAGHLHSLITEITEKGKKLLVPPIAEDVEEEEEDTNRTPALPHQLIAKWNKLSELTLVLNAGLQEICDRWAEGKGPSAAEFTANEMKHLIRALFQNTKRRDAVLAKIK